MPKASAAPDLSGPGRPVPSTASIRALPRRRAEACRGGLAWRRQPGVHWNLQVGRPDEEAPWPAPSTTPSWSRPGARGPHGDAAGPSGPPRPGVDRTTFPSDTISTHLGQPPGVAALDRWGLLHRLVATGCPPIDAYAFDFGNATITGAPGNADSAVAYAPRRTVLDKLLVDAAVEAGAELREGFSVEEVVVEQSRVVGIRGHSRGGRSVTERARVVVGADGLSLVRSGVGAGGRRRLQQGLHHGSRDQRCLPGR
jgi:hypothetical protein